VTIAKQRAHIPAEEDVELVVYSGRRSLYEALSELSRSSSSFASWSVLLSAAERQAVASLVAPAATFRRGEPLALMPFTLMR